MLITQHSGPHAVIRPTHQRRALATGLLVMSVAGSAQAQFFKDLMDDVRRTAENTARQVVVQTAAEMVRDMIIGYSTEQTRSEDEVSTDYERDNGELPVNTKVAAYRSAIYPGDAVRPGTEVSIRSTIEVVRGRNGDKATLEERLTIWDNEDPRVALKSMSKRAARRSGGGEYSTEFSFTLPEGMPQGVYPVTTELTLNGERVGDERHALQLVMLDFRPSGALSQERLARSSAGPREGEPQAVR